MSRNANGRASSLEDVRADLVKRLRARQPEIEAAILVHVRASYGSTGSEDAEYQAGLGAAVAAVVDYALTGIEQGEEWSGPIPSAAITQARRAARNGVNLDTLVLRCIAGHRLLGEFVMDDADRSGYSSHAHALRQLHRTQESLLERLTAAVASEHRREVERMGRSTDRHCSARLSLRCLSPWRDRDRYWSGEGHSGLGGRSWSSALARFVWRGDIVGVARWAPSARDHRR